MLSWGKNPNVVSKVGTWGEPEHRVGSKYWSIHVHFHRNICKQLQDWQKSWDILQIT